jgi:cob(I)alamin adenosyltransferase
MSKCSLQVKRDIRSHAAGLKDIFCKTVDLAMNENLEKVDQIEKTEIKQLDTYIDQVTTNNLHKCIDKDI